MQYLSCQTLSLSTCYALGTLCSHSVHTLFAGVDLQLQGLDLLHYGARKKSLTNGWSLAWSEHTG